METKQKTHEDDIQKFIEPILKRKGDENNIIDLDAYALGFIDAYKELYASEENRKKDEPKQYDVEQAANDSAGGLTNEGTTFERAEHIEGFKAGAKWQSQQPISIQWFSEYDIRLMIRDRFMYDAKTGKYNEIYSVDHRNFFKDGIYHAQSELRKRVNAVDPVEFAIGFKHWCFEYERAQAYIGMSDEELINAYKDHLTSKTK